VNAVQPPQNQLLLAVDGGNSKTDLLVATTGGRILAQVRGDGTRSHEVGVPAMVAGLHRLAERGLREAGADPRVPVAAGAFFLANVDLAADEREVHRELDRIGLADRVAVRNDTLAVLRAGAPAGWGVAVVVGAGVNAVGVGPDGREERFLSLGSLTGDWGGGYSLAEAALGAAVRAGDGRGPRTVLRDVLPAVFGLSTPEEVALGLTRGSLSMSALHRLAPAVLAAAEIGDPVALEISDRLAIEVTTMVLALLARLDLLRAAVPVVLGGGVLQQGPERLIVQIRDLVTAEAPDAIIEVLRAAPVLGALYEALALAGVGTEVIDRAGIGTLLPAADGGPVTRQGVRR
jgi:N-acetylglucosamine kinase-like BadF-type ATPase